MEFEVKIETNVGSIFPKASPLRQDYRIVRIIELLYLIYLVNSEIRSKKKGQSHSKMTLPLSFDYLLDWK